MSHALSQMPPGVELSCGLHRARRRFRRPEALGRGRDGTADKDRMIAVFIAFSMLYTQQTHRESLSRHPWIASTCYYCVLAVSLSARVCLPLDIPVSLSMVSVFSNSDKACLPPRDRDVSASRLSAYGAGGGEFSRPQEEMRAAAVARYSCTATSLRRVAFFP